MARDEQLVTVDRPADGFACEECGVEFRHGEEIFWHEDDDTGIHIPCANARAMRPSRQTRSDKDLVRRARVGATYRDRLLRGSIALTMAERRLASVGLFWNAERGDFQVVNG